MIVALKQAGPWTVGALWNQIWSFAGNTDRQGCQPDVPSAISRLHHEDSRDDHRSVRECRQFQGGHPEVDHVDEPMAVREPDHVFANENAS
jgi:hypothetical protein